VCRHVGRFHKRGRIWNQVNVQGLDQTAGTEKQGGTRGTKGPKRGKKWVNIKRGRDKIIEGTDLKYGHG